jgi:NAD(P)-dependent dehydrogenase (short-subunit alcohol dehydrogenase family)
MGALKDKFGYRTALVTGASSGLGLEFARMLREEGLEVWGASRSPEAVAKQEGWHPVRVDLTVPGSLSTAIEQVRREAGTPDVLINNAGAGVFAGFAHFPPDEIQRQIQLLLTGPIEITRVFWPEMLARKRGAVVNVSSLAAEFPLPAMSLYTAAKAGLSGFSRGLMLESAGHGVQVVDFQPGDFKTNFNRAVQRAADGEAWEERAWARFEELLEHGPLPAQAAADLRRVLLRGTSGTFATGDFFQARIGPLAQRIFGHGLTRMVLRKYFRL